ncbi:hypothetical protein Tco_0861404 [Tanacetum coccineum]|uniref:Uncharacterized protein n=1 Tax=Tanacetum coccineum TaxID=301880 RepID=A0ABQ5BKM3_9ASTR
MSVENVSSGLVPQGQKASDYDNSDPVPPRQNVVPTAEKTNSSQQGLEFLFSPLIEEYYTPTHGQAEENNNDQAPNASFQEDEFINPFCTRVQEIGLLLLSSEGFVDPDSQKKLPLRKLCMVLKQAPKSLAFSDADHAGCIDTLEKHFWRDTVPWTQLKDYGFNYNKIPLYCDSQSAIAISCNPVQHSRTKHIHTRYHFIKEQVENGIIELYFVRTEYQLADMFTKALPEDRFKYLVRRIGMRCLTPAELEVLTNETA